MSSQAVDMYGQAALAAVISYLERVKARCRDPVVTSTEIQRVIKTGFTINTRQASLVRHFVIHTLRERGLLTVWDTKELSQCVVVEYRLNLTPTSAVCA